MTPATQGPGQVTRFGVRRDRSVAGTTRLVTALLVALWLVTCALFLGLGLLTGWPPTFKAVAATVCSLTTVGVLVVLGVGYCGAPRAFSVSGVAVTVHRLAGPVPIPLEGITAARRMQPGELRGAVRLMGNGGLFAVTGRFRAPLLGELRLYLTHMDDAVIVDAGERLLLSPADPEAFIQQVQRGRAALGGQEAGHGQG